MKYVALAVLTFGANVELGLTKHQAAVRDHAVVPVAERKGWYATTAQIQFKVGEEFQYDGDLSKGMAQDAEEVRSAKARTAQAEAAAALAQASEARKGAVQAAQSMLADAEAALAAAQGDEDRAAATQALEQARASLAALG